MPWFKIDDTFAMHEKVMAAGNPAIGLWARAGAWSMQQLTDGFVPDHVLRVLGTPKERRTLVEVSLWVEAEGGIQFKNWSERQPTKEQVETARQAAAERQRHARERAKSQRESRRDKGVSHGPPDPTRPDPTHNYPKSEADGPDEQRPEVVRLCDHLARRVKENGAKNVKVGKRWHDAARLMLDSDGYTEQQVAWLIDKAADDEFWRANILSMPKLREKADQLRLKFSGATVHPIRTDDQGRTIMPPLPPRTPWGPA